MKICKAVEKSGRQILPSYQSAIMANVITNIGSRPPAVEDNEFMVVSFPLPVDKRCSIYLK